MRRVPVLVLASLALGAQPAAAADPIMRLKDVRAGMACTGLSVVRGTAIASFDVEVLDVVSGNPDASGPRILVRVSGPAVDATGVGSGFSGSPILCRDSAGVERNAGAISETVGEYGNKTVLATPIEEILGEPPELPAGARSAPRLLRRSRPLATPLTISGLSPFLRRSVRRAARRHERVVLAAPAGPLASFPRQDLRPGASISAGLSSGDIAVSNIGTVTYRDGSAVWAFGHPLDGVGRRSLPIQDAYVFTVINNPLGSEDALTYKLAAPGHDVGVLRNDGLASIVGRLGAPPMMIPLRVSARDLDSGRRVTLDSRVNDERELELGSGLDLVGTLGLAQAANSALRSSPPRLTTVMCVRIRIRQRRRRLGFCNRYFESEGPFLDFSDSMALLDSFKYGRLDVLGVSVGLRLRRGVQEAFILRGRAPRRVRPGQRIRVRLLLQRRRGGRTRLSFRLRVPRSLRAGRRTLTVRGVRPASLTAATDDAVEVVVEDEVGAGSEIDPDAPGPRTIGELAELIRSRHRSDGLRATFSSRGRGRVVRRSRRLLVRGKLQIPVRVVRRKRRR